MRTILGLLIIFGGFLFAMIPGYLFSLSGDPAPWVYVFTIVLFFAGAVRLLKEGITTLSPPTQGEGGCE